MNLFLKAIALCCFFYLNIAHSETYKRFNYENQPEETFSLENFLKEITMVDQEVKSTCERKVPYQENVCRDVTKYKNECSTIPAHEECKQVNNPICRTETRMEEECYRLPSKEECRQVPNRVCSYETKYERECNTTPDRQECRTVSDQVCRYETKYEQQCRTVPGENQCRIVVRYRQECSSVPGGRQCRTIPGDIQCSIVNGENRCVKIPPREECTDAPGRQECRQVPYEERECSQGPSRQECQQVPRQERVCENVNRQECNTIPGRYECTQVPRQEQVCRDEMKRECTSVPGEEICNNVPREREVCRDNYQTKCETVPAKEVCKKVPYKEQVCKIETKYKVESYECTKTIKVPQEKLIKTHKASVKVDFELLSEILGPEFTVSLDNKGELDLRVTPNDGQNENSETRAAVFMKKDVKNKDEGEINNIDARYKFIMLDANEQLSYLETNTLNGELRKYSFSFKLNGKIDPKRASLGLKIVRKDNVEINKEKISKNNISYTYDSVGYFTTVTVDLKAEGAKIGSIFTGPKAEFETTVTFSQDFSDLGEMVLGKIRNFTWNKSKVFPLNK